MFCIVLLGIVIVFSWDTAFIFSSVGVTRVPDYLVVHIPTLFDISGGTKVLKISEDVLSDTAFYNFRHQFTAGSVSTGNVSAKLLSENLEVTVSFYNEKPNREIKFKSFLKKHKLDFKW